MFLDLQEFAFEGQNMTFTVNVLLTCILYCDAGPGYDQKTQNCLQVQLMNSFHGYHICPPTFFFGDDVAHSRPHSPFLISQLAEPWHENQRALESLETYDILGLPVFMYTVVMFLYTVWERKWRPSRQDQRNLFQALNGTNLANVSVRRR